MPSAIKTKNLSVTLSGFPALQEVTVDLPTGQVVGIIGPSGAGKTTFMRVIVGRQKVRQGYAEVLEQPAGTASLRGKYSYMTQAVSVYSDLTVRQNVRYFAAMTGLKRQARRQETEAALQAVDLLPHADQLAGTLSGGQKQRLSLAVALIGRPELLVLDEPTVGLDPVLREELWQLFRRLVSTGRTIIISSHVMDEAERCDDLVLIRDGRLLAHASPEALCKSTGSQTVEQSFLKLVSEGAAA